MNDGNEYIDVQGRTFVFKEGHRVYLDGGADTGAELPSSAPPAILATKLKDYLASTGARNSASARNGFRYARWR